MSDFILIISFINLLMVILMPMYLKYRSKMSERFIKHNLRQREYTLMKIWRFIALNFSMMLLGLVVMVWLLFTHISVSTVTNPQLIVFGLFLMIYIYGNGIYSTAVINESYTLKPLREIRAFKILRGAELVMHGPVSHVMIFMSTLGALGMICLLEVQQPAMQLSQLEITLLVTNGVLSGGVFALSQIFNFTWKDQMPFLLALADAMILYLLFSKVALLEFEFSLYYFCVVISASVFLIGFFLHQNIHKHPYIYQDLLPKN
jgi:hypothetical protein